MKVVRVRWVDSITYASGWTAPKVNTAKTRRELQHESVGFLLHDDRDFIVIVSSRQRHGDGNVAEGIVIPRAAITRLRVIAKA